MELILHIPHSSIYFPHRKGFLLNENELLKEAEHMGDLHTEELFYPKEQQEKHRAVVASFSRVFCDAERYEDDEKEMMSRFGMGATYTHSDDGEKIRELSNALREDILTEYYRPHHKKLELNVEECLENNEKVLIVDCHSFPNIPRTNSILNVSGEIRPDICIGTDEYHTSKELTEFVVGFFKAKGYSVSLNTPYSGSMVPLKHYRSSPNLSTIMIEINRKLYMDEVTKEKLGSSDEFLRVQDDLEELFEGLGTYHLS
jgi:N-formylglutamate deformylase